MATVIFHRPEDGAERRVGSRWRIWGILFGPVAMLFAGLWTHAALALVGTNAIGIGLELVTGLRPGDPDYLLTYVPGWIFTAVYGGFIPTLRMRKYERLGWIRQDS